MEELVDFDLVEQLENLGEEFAEERADHFAGNILVVVDDDIERGACLDAHGRRGSGCRIEALQHGCKEFLEVLVSQPSRPETWPRNQQMRALRMGPTNAMEGRVISRTRVATWSWYFSLR